VGPLHSRRELDFSGPALRFAAGSGLFLGGECIEIHRCPSPRRFVIRQAAAAGGRCRHIQTKIDGVKTQK